jgi:hypothetical protein
LHMSLACCSAPSFSWAEVDGCAHTREICVMPVYALLLTWFVGDLTSLRAIPLMAVGSWQLVSACGGYSDACSRFRVVVALSFMSLRTVPCMLMLGKDTPASITFGEVFRSS